MRNLPRGQKNFKEIHEMLMAPIKSAVLLSALDLGIFEETNIPRPVEEIAAAIGAHQQNTERLLNALATIGLLEKRNGLYCNSTDAADFLAQSSPLYIGNYLQVINKRCVDTLQGVSNAVKNGPGTTKSDADFTSEQLWAEVTKSSAGWVKGYVGTMMADIVSSLPEFPNFRRMLDLGGGHGMFTLYFVDAHPYMKGYVYDRQVVLSVTKQFISEYGMQDRVSPIAGDYLNDELGSGYDFVWASATLNFARHDLDALLQKIHNSLNPGGIFISFQDGLTHERTQPDITLGHLGDALHMDQDLFFSQGEIADAMLRCGFKSVRSRTIETPMGYMDLDIAKKNKV